MYCFPSAWYGLRNPWERCPTKDQERVAIRRGETYLVHTLQILERAKPCVSLHPFSVVHEFLCRIHEVDDVLN